MTSADDKETAMLLEEKGIVPDEKDMEGFTALQIAEMNEQTEMTHYMKGKTYMDPVKVRLLARSALMLLVGG